MKPSQLSVLLRRVASAISSLKTKSRKRDFYEGSFLNAVYIADFDFKMKFDIDLNFQIDIVDMFVEIESFDLTIKTIQFLNDQVIIECFNTYPPHQKKPEWFWINGKHFSANDLLKGESRSEARKSFLIRQVLES